MKSTLKLKYLHVWAIVVITFISAIAQAKPQTGTIKGKITTSDHQTVPGVSVLIKGTTKGTSIDHLYARISCSGVIQTPIAAYGSLALAIGDSPRVNGSYSRLA